MARLIDADNLLGCYEGLDKYHVPVGVVKANINDMPTVDAVPVVRCKDCVYYNKDVQNFNGYYRCDRYALWQSVDERAHMPLDGFCNYGERKGGDDDE